MYLINDKCFDKILLFNNFKIIKIIIRNFKIIKIIIRNFKIIKKNNK